MSRPLKKVAILGCGFIGTQLALAIDSGRIPAKLERVYDASKPAAVNLVSSLKSKPEISQNAHLLSYPPIDIVVEAASQDAVRDVALSVIQNRRDIIIMSTGALLDNTIHEVLSQASREFGSRVYIPSGAVGGLDAIYSARDEIKEISITTTKNPASLKDAPYFAQSDTSVDDITDGITTLFQGSAVDAVRLFPFNVNVAASVSMAAGRPVSVTVKADPQIKTNTHTIQAHGSFGTMRFTLQNIPDPGNPKTSRLAALSAINTLYKYCARGIIVGS
ncbi:MAG: aspartate dehydrogenase [Cenarchaeum sp. SB0664_bin_35]|nr:aspartate dehydrogenase [Cenarchaeum sp. SB0664_bin_35]